MIDINKKYTYYGKPVRIYADGSDTVNGYMHGAKLCSDGWSPFEFRREALVEVWEPVVGEWVYTWDDSHIGVSVLRYGKTLMCDHIAPFTGTLPDAFKGLDND